MSTYTDLHTRRRENITILRMPGDLNDGITPQRVIFANPENIYEGTFRGTVVTTSADFNDVTLNNATIVGGTLSNATIYDSGKTVSISQLKSDVDAIGSRLEDAEDSIAGLEDSITGLVEASAYLDLRIDNISEEAIALISNEISAISAQLDSKVDNLSSQLVEKIDSDISEMSSSLEAQFTEALQEERDERIEQDTLLQTSILNAVVSLLKHVEDFEAFSDAISSKVDGSIADFNAHVEENREEFNFLSNFMLSSIEKDRHYEIYGTNGELSLTDPCKVKDFAVNIVEAGVEDFLIKYSGMPTPSKVIGYGTYAPSSGDSRQVALIVLNNFSASDLSTALPDPYSTMLSDEVTKNVGGSKFYTIRWSKDLDKIWLDPSDEVHCSLVYDGMVVGAILSPKIDSSDGSLISGLMMIEHTDDAPFKKFYNAFGNFTFNRDSGRVHYNEELSCLISLADDNAHFIFADGVLTRHITEIKDPEKDNLVIGFVRDTGLSADGQTITGISVENINLLSYGLQTDSSALLDAANGFKTWIADGICLSSANYSRASVFDVTKVSEKYKYNFYKDVDRAYSSPQGFIVPSLVNKKITNADFSSLSVMTHFVDLDHGSWLSTYELQAIRENAWQYVYGDPDDDTHDYVSITMTRDQYAFAIDVRCNNASTGLKVFGKYIVDVESEPDVYLEDGTYLTVVHSSMTEFTFDKTEKVAERSYDVRPNFPTPIGLSFVLDTAVEVLPALRIDVPEKEDKYYSASREFIVAAKIKSASDLVEVKLYDYGIEAAVFGGGHHDFFIPTNRWTAFKVTEVNLSMFLLTDLDDNEIRHKLDVLLTALEDETSSRQEDDLFLSSKIDSNKQEIDDIWKNIRGGLNYAGTIDVISTLVPTGETIHDCLRRNFSDYSDASTKLREGFFYVVQTENKAKHYALEGLDVEFGDWLIVNKSTPLSTITSADIDVFDAEDYDNFKLSADNDVFGNNKFKGDNSFYGITHLGGQLSIDGQLDANGSVSIVGDAHLDGSLSVEDNIYASRDIQAVGDILTESTVTARDLHAGDSLTVAEKAIVNGDLSVAGNTDVENASIKSESVERSYILTLSIDISAVSYANDDGSISSLQDLSSSLLTLLSSLLTQLSNTQLSVDGISTLVSSELSDYHNTLSGIDRRQDLENDIKSDNLLVTDPLPNSEHHSLYYLTILSGTMVLKKIEK